MPLIAAQRATPEKDALSVRLDRALHEQLKAYAEFIASSKDHVISQALRHVFHRDKDFAAWLAARPARRPVDTAPPGVSEASVMQPVNADDQTENVHADPESSSRAATDDTRPVASATGGHTRRH